MKIIEFIKGSYVEFKDHVTWPTWPEMQRDTIIVAIATVILALFLFLVDSFFGDVVINNLFKLLR